MPYPIATYDDRELINPAYRDKARQACGRGLAEATIHHRWLAARRGHRVSGGPRSLRSVNISMDLRDAVHGRLEAWLFDR